MAKWRRLKDNIFVRPTPDGGMEGFLREDGKAKAKARASIRKETDGKGVKGKDLVMTASVPNAAKIVMHEELGDDKRDPQARMHWLVNKHPELLLTTPRNVPGCPPRGKKFFRMNWAPKNRSRREKE